MLVFNFHHIEPIIRRNERKHISMTPDGLRHFIHTLRFLGIEIVSLRQMIESPQAIIACPKKAILTFDDGYLSNYEYALPVLESEQCPATIFVLPGRFGGTNEWDFSHLPEPERDRLLTLEQMQRMTQSPYITFGSHGLNHVNFTEIPEEVLHREIHESFAILSEKLGPAFLPVMAYPWGAYSDAVLAAMSQSPYVYGLTVNTAPWQAESNPYEIPRYSAYYRDGNPAILLAKVYRHRMLVA